MQLPDSQLIGRQGAALAGLKFTSLGFAFREQHEDDVGIDAQAELRESGVATGRLLGLQIKTGRSWFGETDDDCFVFRGDQNHVGYWLGYALPVLICLCDVDKQVVYWQIVTRETAIPTGKGYKLKVPKTQQIGPDAVDALRGFLTPVVSAGRYAVLKELESRIGTVKRIAVHAHTNGTLNKAEIATVVRMITHKWGSSRGLSVQSDDRITEKQGAQVVWTYIYLDADDFVQSNPYCRSQWVSDDVPMEYRPSTWRGENVGDNVIIEWSSIYRDLAKLLADRTLNKQEYLELIAPIIGGSNCMLRSIGDGMNNLSLGTIREEAFRSQMAELRERIDRLNDLLVDFPTAPFECRDIDAALRALVARLVNISLYYSERGLSTWPGTELRFQLAQSQTSDAGQTLRALEYEIAKIR